MKNTVIYTAEITIIADRFNHLLNEQRIAEGIKEELGVDDVVITKVQVFEGTDSAKE